MRAKAKPQRIREAQVAAFSDAEPEAAEA
jgi:hypothetical protein